MLDYQAFLQSKRTYAKPCGFEVDPRDLPPSLKPFQSDVVSYLLRIGRGAAFEECGLGKGQPPQSKVLTPTGWATIGSLVIGDRVISSSGKSCNVTGVYPKPEQDVYRVWFSDRTSIVVDIDHLHLVLSQNAKSRGGKWEVLSTAKLLNRNLRYGSTGKSRRYEIPTVNPVEFDGQHAPLPIHPYVVGTILGNGGTTGTAVMLSSRDVECVRRCSLFLPAGCEFKKTKDSDCDYRLVTGRRGGPMHPVRRALSDLGMRGVYSYQKSIPKQYLTATVDDRIELLRGLMDTDGYIQPAGTSEFYSTSKRLADDVVFLVQSLGGIPTRAIKKAFIGSVQHRDCHVVTFSLRTFNPFWVERKACRWNKSPRDNARRIDRIEFEGRSETVCIAVDSTDRTYVTENCIVTHNTSQSLAWAAAVAEHTSRPVLMLCPLAVAGQTKREAEKFNIGRGNIPIEVVASSEAIQHHNEAGIYITNYDKMLPAKGKPKRFDTSLFSGVWLDESSILKGYTSKTKQTLCDEFVNTPYRGAGTATPSPNDLLELGNHAEFLGAMPSSEMIARWFINDLAHSGKYRLKHHAEKDYWEWVASWAVSLSTPADLGYSDEGYVLPPLNIEERVIEVDEGPPLSGQLFANTPLNATTIFQEKRHSLASRAEEVAAIVNASSEAWVVWCDMNDESKELKRRIPDAIEVTGSMHDTVKETLIDRFSTGQARVIISKPSICGFGVNWQHCRNAAFVGLTYSFEAFYQAVRRLWRFGQIHPVRCVVVNSPAEQQIWRTVMRKESAHLELQGKMSGAMRRAQMQLVRGIREVEKYEAGERMVLPAWLNRQGA